MYINCCITIPGLVDKPYRAEQGRAWIKNWKQILDIKDYMGVD